MNTVPKVDKEEGKAVCEYCGRKYDLLKAPDGRYLDLNHGACHRAACKLQSIRKHL